MKHIIVLHGPNLNLLGERETAIYGEMTLSRLNAFIREEASRRGIKTKIFQSNSEGALIDFIHKTRKWAEGIVINPGAYTHYSYAIRDAVSAVEIPAVEVHISDIKKRESWRRRSVIAPVCIEQISGRGAKGYVDAMEILKKYGKRRKG